MLFSLDVCNFWAELGEQNPGVLFSINYSIYRVVLLFDCDFAIHFAAGLTIIYE